MVISPRIPRPGCLWPHSPRHRSGWARPENVTFSALRVTCSITRVTCHLLRLRVTCHTTHLVPVLITPRSSRHPDEAALVVEVRGAYPPDVLVLARVS